MSEGNAADQHRDHPAHVQQLSYDVAQYSEEIGDHNLSDLTVH